MKYDYREAITADILDYIHEHYTPEEIYNALETEHTREAFQEELNDDLWVCDSVTGSAPKNKYTLKK